MKWFFFICLCSGIRLASVAADLRHRDTLPPIKNLHENVFLLPFFLLDASCKFHFDVKTCNNDFVLWFLMGFHFFFVVRAIPIKLYFAVKYLKEYVKIIENLKLKCHQVIKLITLFEKPNLKKRKKQDWTEK